MDRLRATIFSLLILLFVICGNVNASSIELHGEHNSSTSYLMGIYSKQYKNHCSKVNTLTKKVVKLKDKHHLQYINMYDLLETVNYIVAYERKPFTSYYITSFFIKESKLYSKALNKVDGGRGLGQLTGISTLKQVPYVIDPFNKSQGIRGSIDIMYLKYQECNNNFLKSIERYNGAGIKAHKYMLSIQKIHNELINI